MKKNERDIKNLGSEDIGVNLCSSVVKKGMSMNYQKDDLTEKIIACFQVNWVQRFTA
jgi:hypothetical protein